MADSNTDVDDLVCPHCRGSGLVKPPKVIPWRTWKERIELGKKALPGERWIQIKSGRVVVIVEGCAQGYRGQSLKLKHENGRTTDKWYSYFGQEYTPETPPV